MSGEQRIDDELRRMVEASQARVPDCGCDFCAGKKRWADNWCPRCAKVQMALPKRWDDLDVCDECEKAVERELAEEAKQP